MKSETHSNGGYWMLFGLVVLLAAPPIIGHFVIAPTAAPSVHAEVAAPVATAN